MSRADLTNSPLNRGWFRGQIQYIIEYGLATKVYFPGTKTIEYLLLSSRGKRCLQRSTYGACQANRTTSTTR